MTSFKRQRGSPTNNYKLKHEINLIGCETEAARVYIVEEVAIKAFYGGTRDKSAVRDHDGELRIELLMDGSGGAVREAHRKSHRKRRDEWCTAADAHERPRAARSRRVLGHLHAPFGPSLDEFHR